MQRIWIICILVGIILPLISVLSSADFDLDLDLDIGFDFDFLPLSLKPICFGILFYASVADILYLTTKLNIVIINFIGAIVGYGVCITLQKLFRFLKSNKGVARTKLDILCAPGIVTNRIAENGYGQVLIYFDEASSMSYPAKSKNGDAIECQTNIFVMEQKDGYLVVDRDKADYNKI